MKRLRITHLQPAEILEVTSRLQAAVADSGLNDSFVKMVLQLLEEDKQDLQRAISAIRTNSYIEDVSEADDFRDDLFISFRDMVNAYKRRKANKIKDAYTVIWPILEQAGTQLHRLGYNEQSGQMEALFTELDKAASQEAMNELGLTDLYAKLKQSQVDFLSIYTDRLEEDARKDYPTLKEARKKIFPHITVLVSAIGVLFETDAKNWQPVADRINTIITEVMSTASARKTRKMENTEDTNY